LIESEEALRIGLVNFVVDDAQLESQVRDYARRIVANAPLTMHAAKASLAAFERDSLDAETVKKLTGLIDRCFDSEDFKEGRSAFSEKRAPRFRGC
jgi:enoyl-CoA hydratase/carnithine racemase